MVKRTTITRKVKEVDDGLDRYIDGKYPTYSIEWLTNQIEWLYRYKHIDEATKDRLCDKAMLAIEASKYN